MKNFVKKHLIPFLRKLGRPLAFFFDLLIVPFLMISSFTFLFYRWVGSKRFPLSTTLLKKIGVFPIRDHHYEPFFNDAHLKHPLDKDRNLPGIDFNLSQQLEFLKQLNFSNDFKGFLEKESRNNTYRSFQINNGSFGPGDADFLFNFIRYLKPSKVIEIGSGNSTLVLKGALEINRREGKDSEHLCIEPYKNWLDEVENITIVKEKLEDTDISWSENLNQGDFLFIDSSHMIRPQGDVLYEYLEILPKLKPGVIVHVHDIFSPRDYPQQWIQKDVRFWNEQYLLEALLGNSSRYEVLASLNFLKQSKFEELSKICKYLTKESEPGSFYFRIIN